MPRHLLTWQKLSIFWKSLLKTVVSSNIPTAISLSIRYPAFMVWMREQSYLDLVSLSLSDP